MQNFKMLHLRKQCLLILVTFTAIVHGLSVASFKEQNRSTESFEKKNSTKETCSVHDDCRDHEKCVENEDGWKTCQCADGLSGPNCEEEDWCKDTGKFKDCRGINGTCAYNKEKRSIDCTCGCGCNGRKLHPDENRCRATCAKDSDCENDGKCEVKGESKFCSCKPGIMGDKCQAVFDCTSQGKYKNCGGLCYYRENKAVCRCLGDRALDDLDNICKECNCGPSVFCVYKNGQKRCFCKSGYVQKDGKCTECDCGPEGYCEFENGQKKCVCYDGYADKNGTCTECDCGEDGSCSFQNGQKKCFCFGPGTAEKDGTCV